MRCPEQAATNSPDAQTWRTEEQRILKRVLTFAVPSALVVLLVLPNVGPIFRLYNIPSTAMMPALPIGSLAVVSRTAYGYSRYSFDAFELPIEGRWPAGTPRRGDITVFRLPRDPSVHYVKRVVGLPGDRIQMLQGRLSINGQITPREPRPSVPNPFDGKGEAATYQEALPDAPPHRIIETEGDRGFLDNTAVFEVPPGHLFMLGDNRDNSSDSRSQTGPMSVGFVPVELVIGRVIATFGGRATE